MHGADDGKPRAAAVDGGKLAGLISIGDLVKDIISEQKFIIEQPSTTSPGSEDEQGESVMDLFVEYVDVWAAPSEINRAVSQTSWAACAMRAQTCNSS